MGQDDKEMPQLRFGVLLDHQYAKSDQLLWRIRELIEMAQAVRDLAYDSIFVLHHYLAPLQTLQPISLLSRLLEYTGRMQVGTGILIVPLVHPVHLAEELATVDQLSGGRLVVGMGAGYRDAEFDAFGIDRKQRMGRLWESIQVMTKLWTGEPVTHDGTYFRLRDATCSVLPIQHPHPPIWIGSGGEHTIRQIGREGYTWIVSGAAKARWACGNLASHLEERTGAGCPGPYTAVVHRDLWIGDSERSAFEDIKEYMNRSAREYAPFGMSWAQAPFEDRSLKAGIFGSPEEVAEKIRSYAEAGFNHFVFRVQWLGCPIQSSIRTLERFQEEVIPLLRTGGIV